MAGSAVTFDIIGRDKASATFDKVGKSVDSTSSKMAKFNKVGDLAGKALAAGLLGVGAAAIKLGQQASDLAETQSKVNQIFGKQGAAALDKFAASAATNLGQSKQTALDAAASFGVFGKAAGLEGNKLAGFSKHLTVLASDMASFGNTSPEQAVEALGAALRGESEPIRAYGVMLDEATLKAEALNLGLLKPVKDQAKIKALYITLEEKQRAYKDAVEDSGKGSLAARKAEAALNLTRGQLKKATEGTIGPLTQQQKVLAAQSAIMKQTKDQQGDFARTSEGLANKQRILKAQMANLGTEIGAKVLPAMVKLTAAGLKAIDWIGRHEKLVGILAASLGGLLATVWAVSTGIKAWTAVSAAATAVQTAFTAASVGTRIQLAALAVQQAIITAATKTWTAVQWALNVALNANPIGLIVIAIAALVAGLVIAYKKSETFRKIVDGAFRAVQKAASFAFEWVKKNWPLLLAIITGPIGLAVYAVVKNWDRIKAATSAAWDAVKGAISGAWDAITSRIANAVDRIKTNIGRIVGFVQAVPGKILHAIGNLGRLLWDAGRAVIQGLIDGIKDKFGDLIDVLGTASDLIQRNKGPIEKDRLLLKPAGIAIMEGLIKGIESGKPALTKVLDKLTNFIERQGQKIADLMGKRSDLIESFGGFTSSVFTAEPKEGEKPTADSLLAFQKAELAKAQRLKRNVAKLLKMGLSRDLIQQLAASGESGLAQINALASGSSAQVQQLNALNASTQQALTAAGTLAGNDLYASDIRDAKRAEQLAQALAKALTAEQRKHPNQPIHIHLEGKEIVYSINKYQDGRGKDRPFP